MIPLWILLVLFSLMSFYWALLNIVNYIRVCNSLDTFLTACSAPSLHRENAIIVFGPPNRKQEIDYVDSQTSMLLERGHRVWCAKGFLCSKCTWVRPCLWCVQVILAVLARGYEWSVDQHETFIQTSPLPALTNGMPLKCWKRDQPMCPSSLGTPVWASEIPTKPLGTDSWVLDIHFVILD